MTPELLGKYKVNMYSPTGTLRAVFDDWKYLEIQHLVNDPGYCRLGIDGDDNRTSLFEDNSIIEVLRKMPGNSPAAVPSVKHRDNGWYVEYEGLHVDVTETSAADGSESFESYSRGYLDLAARRYIMWKTTVGASESKKVGIPAQTAMYQFVNENCGPAALAASGRLIDGVVGGLSVPAWVGNGANWYGSRSYRSLISTLQAIANYASIDFDIVGLGGANWQFETYVDQLGEDRTTTGIGADGKNSAGNSPVIFSIPDGNVSRITYRKKKSGSANVVATAGQGQYAARQIGLVTDSSEIDGNRINQREIVRNANTQDSVNELTTLANEYLEKFQPLEDFDIIPLVAQSTLYGVDFWWGDKVTARYKTLERNKRLLGVTIVVTPEGEKFRQWNFWTIP